MSSLTKSLTLAVLFCVVQPAQAQNETLRPSATDGQKSNVTFSLKVTGNLHMDAAGKNKIPLEATGNLTFEEKLIPSANKSVRYYTTATSKSITQATVAGKTERKEVVRGLDNRARYIVAESDPKLFLFSPSGPIKHEELALIDAGYDPIVIDGILPSGPVGQGASWKVDDDTLIAILRLDKLFSHDVNARVQVLTEKEARIRFSGKATGVGEGARTIISVSGVLLFDRTISQITQVAVNQNESRLPGTYRPGLKVSAQFSWERRVSESTPSLDNDALVELSLEPSDATRLLMYEQTEKHWRVYMNRNWRFLRADPRKAVLRFVNEESVMAQCDVVQAPTTGAGSHMEPSEFLRQVKNALGARFGQVLEDGVVETNDDTWIYRLAISGKGEKPTIWYYYIAASPDGRQVFFIFNPQREQVEQFGTQDLALVTSLKFQAIKTASNEE